MDVLKELDFERFVHFVYTTAILKIFFLFVFKVASAKKVCDCGHVFLEKKKRGFQESK